jgi:hypothetical protein
MNINDVTIVMPTSVISDHPDTTIIDTVISSVRHHFPENEIILQIDGLRKEQSHRKDSYDEYKNRVLWKCLHEWKNVLPVVFEEHSHQSTMMSKTIDLVRTPAIFYVEGDVAIKTDVKIDWQPIMDMLDSEEAYTVRFYSFNKSIEPSHEYLMLEQKGDFIKTFQWSQQPHFSMTSYYRDVVIPNIPPKAYIEDKFYGKVFADCHEDPQKNWGIHRLWMYNPVNKKDIRVVKHLDGRKNLRKFNSDDKAWGLTES